MSEPAATTLAADGTQGCLAITCPYAPPQLGIVGIKAIIATFDGAFADRHPPTGPAEDPAGDEHPGREGVRLLTWGDSYLTAWSEAVRGKLLTEMDYKEAEMDPAVNPLHPGHSTLTIGWLIACL